MTLFDSIKHCFVSLNAPAAAHQASGSGSGAGVEVSAEGNVVEENVIPESAFLNPTDPECDVTLAEEDVAQRQPEKLLDRWECPLASLMHPPEGSLTLGTSSPADIPTHVTFLRCAYTAAEIVTSIRFNVGAARQICLGSEVRSRAENMIVQLKEKLQGPVVLRDQFLVFVAADKSLLSTEVSALKNVVSQKDTDISLLDSRASYLKSALDDSQAACEMDLHRVSTLHSAFSDFKEKMEAQQEEQAQELYNRVAELEAHVMDVSGLLEEEFYPAYLTTLAGRRPCRGLYGNARSCPYLATVPRATLRPHRNNADEMLLPGDFFVLCSSLTFMGVTRA
ncbi:hypothetical protein Tco_1230125 [Tanacetum coccineum]